MTRLHAPISQTLDQATQAALEGDLATGLDLAQTAQKTWDAHWHTVAILADHTPMDEIDARFAQLQAYGRSGQHSEFAAMCAHVSKLVDATAEAHRLTWWNLS